MASSRKLFTKDGTPFYEISVSRGRGKSRLSTRWYPPHGWSQRAIDKELKKQEAAFETAVKEGKILSKEEQKEQERLKALEYAQIKTFKQYSEQVFMPNITIKRSENTRSSYQGNLDNWIYPSLGDYKISNITTAQIEALLTSMQQKGKSHATCIKVYNIINGIFKKARKDGTISSNPMEYVDRPEPRKDEEAVDEAEAYTADEVKYILKCLAEEPLKWRLMIRLLVDTGMRRGECCALQWSGVDFANNTITVSGNLCYTPQKGIYLDTSKNRRRRKIDVDPQIMLLLKQQRQAQAKKVISPYVFTQDDTADPMHPHSPTKYLKKFENKYGVDHLYPHKLRHSFASIAITNGADIASVSEKMGHRDKATTLRMYTHANEDSIKQAGNVFREAIKEA